MTDLRAELNRLLATCGADLSRWPRHAAAARKALLADPNFRDAFERERDLDLALDAWRAALDAEIASSGAAGRVKAEAMRRAPANYLAGIPWRRVAAGVLVAGMLGGALDLMLPDPAADQLDVAIADPLDVSVLQ